jgi:ABC-type uncharacterized transport system auxiliary subunit
VLYTIGFCCGCANIPLTHYYTFQPEVEKKGGTKAPKYPYVMAVDTFEADVPYQQDKIVFRTSPYEVNFYEYHKWLRPPEELVTNQIVKLVSAAGMFQNVHARAFEAYSDYIIRGKIKMFDQWYKEDKTSFVQVHLEYYLIASEEEQIIWTDTVKTTADISNLNIVETVKGFETALQENILQALTSIDSTLSQ